MNDGRNQIYDPICINLTFFFKRVLQQFSSVLPKVVETETRLRLCSHAGS